MTYSSWRHRVQCALLVGWLNVPLAMGNPAAISEETCGDLLKMTREVSVVRVSKQCVGSCRVHAMIGMLESRILKERGTPVALSAGFITASVFAQNFARSLHKLDPQVGIPTTPEKALLNKIFGRTDEAGISEYWKKTMSTPARNSDDEDLDALIHKFGIVPATALQNPDSIEEKLASDELRNQILGDKKVLKKILALISSIRTSESKLIPLTAQLSVDKKRLSSVIRWIEDNFRENKKFTLKDAASFAQHTLFYRIPEFDQIDAFVLIAKEIAQKKMKLEKNLTQIIFNALGEINIDQFTFDNLTYTPQSFARFIFGKRKTKLQSYPTTANLVGYEQTQQQSQDLLEAARHLADLPLDLEMPSLETLISYSLEEHSHFDRDDALIDILDSSQEFSAEQLAHLRRTVERKIRAEIDQGHSVGVAGVWLKTLQDGNILKLPSKEADAARWKGKQEADWKSGHAFQIIGYQIGANDHVTLWKIQNSWGTDVGENGLFYMTPEYLERFVYKYYKIELR